MVARAQQLRRFAALKSQKWCFGTNRDRQDATVRLICGVEVVRMVFWCASMFVARLPPNEAIPSVEMTSCRGL
eukprot:385924-Pyramimonas_sp.AAC.1